VLSQGHVLQGRYRIDCLLGEGGMGTVYRATHLLLGTSVAMKTQRLMSSNPSEQRKLIEQFEAEARILASLSHPNLAQVKDFFEEGTAAYLVMEFIEGCTLEDTVRSGGPMDEARTLTAAGQVLDALEYLHGRTPPVIVRDLKPSNLMMEANGRVRLIDFGIAKVMGRNTYIRGAGSAGFAPIEQYGQGSTDQRSDLYAFGATLLFLLTGLVPPEATLRITDNAPLPEPQAVQASVSQRTCDTVRRLMAVAPGDRPASVAMAQLMLGMRIEAEGGAATEVTRQSVVTARSQASVPPPLPTNRATPVPSRTAPGAIASTHGLRFLKTNAEGYQEFENEKDGSVLIEVPGGEFMMGSTVDEVEEMHRLGQQYNEFQREEVEWELPAHRVTVGPFFIGKYEVTNSQFRRFVDATGYDAGRKWREYAVHWGQDAPVVYVSWDDAFVYCNWAGLKLPSESQWEYAARGPEARRYPWGNWWDGNRCNSSVIGTKGLRRGVSVGSFQSGASFLGCMDMSGNVWEWTADWFGRYPGYATAPEDHQMYRVVRGGSGDRTSPVDLRGARRNRGSQNFRGNVVGFRCAREW